MLPPLDSGELCPPFIDAVDASPRLLAPLDVGGETGFVPPLPLTRDGAVLAGVLALVPPPPDAAVVLLDAGCPDELATCDAELVPPSVLPELVVASMLLLVLVCDAAVVPAPPSPEGVAPDILPPRVASIPLAIRPPVDWSTFSANAALL